MVTNLTVCKAVTAGPTSYSEPIELIPLIPPGAAPRIVVIISTLSNLLVHKLMASPVIISVNVIEIAGFHKDCNSTNEPLVKLVPMPIFNIVLVSFGYEAESTFSLMLKNTCTY